MAKHKDASAQTSERDWREKLVRRDLFALLLSLELLLNGLRNAT
jgi:hypothetical protein